MNKTDINKIPLKFKTVFSALFGLLVFLIPKELDTDFYFLYKSGEYICNNGFPVKDFLSWHENMDIIVQQWLFDVLLYKAYSVAGKAGLFIAEFVMCLAVSALIYMLCKKVSKNFFVSFVASFSAAAVIAAEFIVTRPQCFTYLMLIAELLLLEQYVSSKKAAFLIGLPIISVILINMHASMWPMMFVFLLPYFAQAIPVKTKRISQKPCCSFIFLAAAAVSSLVCGFINPYGLKSMLYLITSYGSKELNDGVTEMNPITASSPVGLLFLGIMLAVLMFAVLGRRNKSELRFVLLCAGTAVLALSSVKAFPYFLISAAVFITSTYKNFTFKVNVSTEKANRKTLFIRFVAGTVAILLICVLLFMQFGGKLSDEVPFEKEINPAVFELKSIYKDDTILFNGFNSGAYLEYCGIPAFIDARAEVFLEKNNHEADYYSEYYKVVKGDTYYKEFIDKYGFNCCFISNVSEAYLYNSLLHDSDFSAVYNDGNYSIFLKNS